MNGILILDKPQGMTSHDVVMLVRRGTGIKRVGHTGTLDPMATGVLPVCLGTATRIMEYLDADQKEYRCTLRLGVETDTQDIWGETLKTRSWDALTPEQIRDAILSFQGVVTQIPPKYSALKVNGRRLYDYARAGIDVDIKSREIIISSIFVNHIQGREADFTVVCPKGTYIRTLCSDIGQKLGCGAAMASLVRLGSGLLRIEDSIPAMEMKTMAKDEIWKRMLPTDTPLKHMEELLLAAGEAKDFTNGKTLHFPNAENRLVRIYYGEEFIGVGRQTPEGLRADKVFNTRLQHETV